MCWWHLGTWCWAMNAFIRFLCYSVVDSKCVWWSWQPDHPCTSCVVYLLWWSSLLSHVVLHSTRAAQLRVTYTCQLHGGMVVEITCKCVCVVPYTLCCSYSCVCHSFWTWCSCSKSPILVHHACCKTTYTSHRRVNNIQFNIIVFQSLRINPWTICKLTASYIQSA